MIGSKFKDSGQRGWAEKSGEWPKSFLRITPPIRAAAQAIWHIRNLLVKPRRMLSQNAKIKVDPGPRSG